MAKRKATSAANARKALKKRKLHENSGPPKHLNILGLPIELQLAIFNLLNVPGE
jgi:hypothetical protein